MPVTAPSSRVEAFDVLVPAGTPKAAPLETLTKWNPGELVGVEVYIPDGHNGLTGIRLAVAHAQVIPATAGAWLVGNDEKIAWDTVGYLNTGAWSVFAYNTDLFDHTFHVRYLIADFAFTNPALPHAPAVTPALS